MMSENIHNVIGIDIGNIRRLDHINTNCRTLCIKFKYFDVKTGQFVNIQKEIKLFAENPGDLEFTYKEEKLQEEETK